MAAGRAVDVVGLLSSTVPELERTAPAGGSLHYAVGPTVALVALLGLLLACRWVFSTSSRRPAARPLVVPPSSSVLVGLVEVPDEAAARAAVALLADAGVPGQVARTDLGHQVRVFVRDEARAREVLRAVRRPRG